MDWLDSAAQQLREWLMQKAWLRNWHPSFSEAPDWALLAAGPATLLLSIFLLRINWRQSQVFRAEKDPVVSRQREEDPQPVATPLGTTSLHAPPGLRQSVGGPVVLPELAAAANEEGRRRSVRVFISSTFLDMQAERKELVTKVFPALRAKYRARGVDIFEVDLRWGITREQQERGETLPTLLAEIDRCRPYFVGLVGDRYGWVPPVAALTDKLKCEYPVLADAHGASITALEIIHGVLSSSDTGTCALFFERDPSWDWVSHLNESDRLEAISEPDAARAKLAELKAKLRQHARVEMYARPEEIVQKVTDALDALLEARFPETQSPDAFERTAGLHSAYARERRVLHVGAESYVRELNNWIDTSSPSLLLISGPSGAGKSALVANWLDAWRSAHPESAAFVFEHYLGASPDSADAMVILHRLWDHLDRALQESVELPRENNDLMVMSSAIAERLKQAHAVTEARGAYILIALDGLDKLSSGKDLRWLPTVPGVHMLLSSLDCPAKAAVLARGCSRLEVEPLSLQDRQKLVAGILARWRRTLEPNYIAQVTAPASAALAGSPLYLKTVLEELRVSADQVRLAERLEDYRGARDMPDLFDRVLRRLEIDCEPELVSKVLPLIWASRAGLAEYEIISAASVSPLGWATLCNSLGDGLRDQQGRIVLGHDYLSRAVETRYLASDAQKCAAHRALADYFDAPSRADNNASQASWDDNRFSHRALSELPFQLFHASERNRLDQLLESPDWIETKFDALGWRDLVEDYEQFANDGRPIQLQISRALRLCASILTRDRRQLWPQLHGRLLKEGPTAAAFLEAVMARVPSGALHETQVALSESGLERTRFDELGAAATALALLPDGQLAAGFNDGGILILDETSATRTRRLEHGDIVRALAVLPDGKLASAGGNAYGACDYSIKIWDVVTGLETARLNGHWDVVNALTVLPDGRLASGASDSTIRLWNPSGWRQDARLDDRNDVESLAVLADGCLAGGSSAGTVRLWDIKTGTETACIEAHKAGVRALAALPDGRLASGSTDATICIWDVATCKAIARISGTGEVWSLASLTDGRLVSGDDDDSIKVWDSSTGTELERIQAHGSWVSALIALPGGRLASGSYDQTVRIWDVRGSEVAAGVKSAHQGHGSWVDALAVLADGRLASGSGGRDRSIRIWDTHTHLEVARLEGHNCGALALLALPDGRLVGGMDDHTIRIWDPVATAEIACLRGHTSTVNALALLPNGYLASGSGNQYGSDFSIRIWDLSKGEEVACLVGHTGYVNALAVLTDGRLVSGSGDYEGNDAGLRIWNTARATEDGRFVSRRARARVRALAALPGGRIASGSDDLNIRVWDKDREDPISIAAAHDSVISALATMPDGRLVSGAWDNTIRLWDAHAETEASIMSIDGRVSSLAVLPDGRVVAGDEFGRIHWLATKA